MTTSVVGLGEGAVHNTSNPRLHLPTLPGAAIAGLRRAAGRLKPPPGRQPWCRATGSRGGGGQAAGQLGGGARN